MGKSTPGTALVGYAILRANYNAQAPSYLDNFAPFVLSAIASAGAPSVERSQVSDLIRESFGVHIPALVIKKLLRRTNHEGLTEPVGNDAIKLTTKASNELPDLNAEVAQYRNRQIELVTHFAAFIESHFPDHLDLTTGDLSTHLAEFFDKNAVPLLGNSLGKQRAQIEAGADFEYVVAAFVEHLSKSDQQRFSYVVEAVKGAMLASVLELDTANMRDSLKDLTLVLDTPVAMDLLGHHGAAPEKAIKHVLDLARAQGASITIFRHSLSELDGILESIENALRRGPSRMPSRGYLHFSDAGATPVDVAMLRRQLDDSLVRLDVRVIDLPGGYYEYGLDEAKLEEMIQSRVHYSQDSARTNDVRSLSAVHRTRRGNGSTTIERCMAVMVSSNESLVRGARDFDSGRAFPLAITTEAIASILWARSPATADDVPREMVLASAYVGMQPSPLLWNKYAEEIAKLESSGAVTPDELVLLRLTSAGREAFMEETLGDDRAINAELPRAVLRRVQDKISEPLQQEVAGLEAQLTTAQGNASQAQESVERESVARQEAAATVASRDVKIGELQNSVTTLKFQRQKQIERIRLGANETAHTRTAAIAWIVRAVILLGFAGVVWWLLASKDYKIGSVDVVIAVLGVLGVCGTFFPMVTNKVASWRQRSRKRIARSRLRAAGFDEEAEESVGSQI